MVLRRGTVLVWVGWFSFVCVRLSLRGCRFVGLPVQSVWGCGLCVLLPVVRRSGLLFLFVAGFQLLLLSVAKCLFLLVVVVLSCRQFVLLVCSFLSWGCVAQLFPLLSSPSWWFSAVACVVAPAFPGRVSLLPFGPL